MSGFHDHFVDKYFGYRRRYVESVAALAPRRRSWAVASEIARLAFVTFASVLCALIFGALTIGAFPRGGALPWLFAALTLLPALFTALALRGVAVAVSAGRQANGAAKARR